MVQKKNLSKATFIKRDGFTLLELIITLTIVSIVFAVIYSMSLYGLKTYAKGNDQSAAQFDARVAADIITNEVRYATELEIHPGSYSVPSTVSDDYKYLFLRTEITNTNIIIKSKDGEKKHSLGSVGNITFDTVTPFKVLYFTLTGIYNKQSFEVDSDTAILNLPKNSVIIDSVPSEDGVILKYKVKKPIVKDPLVITTNIIDNGKLNQEYNQTILAAGGSGSYTFAISEGIFPPGLNLDAATGKISEKPTVEGVYYFTVSITDSATKPQIASKSYTMMVIDESKTAASVAASITGISNPGVNATQLTLPTVPGFSIEVLSVNPAGVINPNGAITPPISSTDVKVKLIVTKIGDNTTAHTSEFTVTVPAKDDDLVINYAPTASNVFIRGNVKVGNVVEGIYTYRDTENDPEGVSQYQWFRSATDDGNNLVEIGTNSKTYTIQADDLDKYLYFKVTPIADNGTSSGISVLGEVSEKVKPSNSPPAAKNVQIVREIIGTNTGKLKGSYDYEDVDGDLQGYTTFQWYRKEKNKKDIIKIVGAISIEISYGASDKDAQFYFEVTPVALTGDQKIGNTVRSDSVTIN